MVKELLTLSLQPLWTFSLSYVQHTRIALIQRKKTEYKSRMIFMNSSTWENSEQIYFCQTHPFLNFREKLYVGDK